jgi:hypothetical protein
MFALLYLILAVYLGDQLCGVFFVTFRSRTVGPRPFW